MRRQRKNPADPQQLSNKVPKGMMQREKETILKDKNFLSSISDLCKSENNLNLLSSKITSILNCNLKEMNKKLLNNVVPSDMSGVVGMEGSEDIDDDDEDIGNSFHGNNDFSAENMNASDMEAKMLAAAGKNMRSLLQQKRNEEAALLNESISGNDTNDMDEDDDDSERNSFKTPINRRSLLENSQLAITSNPRFKDFLIQTNQNLVISKGSKKWINDSMEMDDNDAMAQANRDFLSKLISQKLHKSNRGVSSEVGNEHSPILDVDSNMHHHAHLSNHHQQQQNQQAHDQFNQPYANQQNGVQQNNNNGDNSSGGMMEMQQQPQYTTNNVNSNNNSNQTFNTHFNPLGGGFYNGGNANVNRNMVATIPTSASLLVEAALSSVSSMIGNAHDMNDNGNNQQMAMDDGNDGQQPEDLPDEMNSPEFQQSAQQQQNFPIHLPSMSTFANNVGNAMMQDNSEIDVDAASTPKSQDKMCAYTPSNSGEKEVQGAFQNQQNDSCSPARTMTPDQHNSSYTASYAAQRNAQQVQQIQTSPGQLSQRPLYGSEHDLVNSPASTPSLPRYDFGAENYRARREKNLSANIEYNKSVHQHHASHAQQTQQNPQMTPQMSSDEENSIVIAENLSVNHQAQQQSHVVNEKLKLNSQISELMYTTNKYGDNSAINQLHRESLNDLRLKYNEQGLEIQEFAVAAARNQVVNDNVTGGSGNSGDYHQGLDMTSRAGIASGYHSHNFQIASSAAAAAASSSFNRYQHHIYDILTERDQQNAQQAQQQDHHPFQLQQQQQQIQHLLQDHISATHQDHDSDPSGVDLSRTSNYIVPPSPPTPHLPSHSYPHAHSEMLRMASLDLSSAGSSTSSGMVGGNNSHHVRHHPSFIPPHASSNREISDHHRFLSTADQRLLVDPTAHLLIEQNNRLLSASAENNRILDQSRLLTASEGPVSNRHVVSPRGFGAYHHHPHHSHPHQVKYHHQGPPSNQQQNYHPFSASYY